MKKILLFLVAAFVIMTAFTSQTRLSSGIHGTIDPPDAAKKIWAISGRDTFSAVPAPTGVFSLETKPGTWRLIVEAIDPYKSVVVSDVFVQEGQSTDAGIIKLVK